MDETEAESAEAEGAEARVDAGAFEEFAEALAFVVLRPASLACMKKGHGGFYRWEGTEDMECLEQISRHWSLLTKSSKSKAS